jgi:glyoxylase-like metal-dependent hydrolase (beta-lactamase superfamily II)
MKVIPLRAPDPIYSGWAYLLLGDWNRLDDVNTLIDTGTDGGIVDLLPGVNTGIGKRQVDQVFLTHSHFDHAGGVGRVTAAYDCPVGAAAPGDGIARILHDGEILRIADREAEVIRCTEHSMDSLCFYVRGEGALFTGDTPMSIHAPGGSYSEDFLRFLERLMHMRVNAIYTGHDAPVLEGAQELIASTFHIVERSSIIFQSSG